MMEDSLVGKQATLTTSIIMASPTLDSLANEIRATKAKIMQAVLADLNRPPAYTPPQYTAPVARTQDESTVNGVMIGLLSSFGSAILIAMIFLIIYFFRYTSNGRILLDRMGRPGEYDDEQAFAREEAEALEQMDDLQRMEYLRAKGMLVKLFHALFYSHKFGWKC